MVFRPKSIFDPIPLRGPQGPRGDTGGATGPAGPPGADGSGLVWRGAWSGATAYAVNDAVESAGSSYVCILAHTNHGPPNPTYWELLAAKGATGATGLQGPAGDDGVDGVDGTDGTDGTGITWRGAWLIGTAYVADDAVQFGGSAYVCILANTGHAPPNATYWELFAAAGAEGDPGDSRPAGFGASFDGGASVLSLSGTTIVLTPPSPYAGTIGMASVGAIIGPGSATVGIKKAAAGTFPGGLADITGGHDLVLTAASDHQDSTLTDWDLDVGVGDRFEFELKAVDGVLRFLTAFLTMD